MMLLPMLLCSCGAKNDELQTALDFRAALLEAGGCSFTADVEADYGDRLYDFTLSCSYDGDDGSLTVTAPESIAGISAVVRDGTSVLEFDGAALEFGPLANGFPSPLVLPWLLGSAWSEDYIARAGMDGDRVMVTWLKGYNDEELTIQTWFTRQIPVRVEVVSAGRRVLTAELDDFSLNK